MKELWNLIRACVAVAYWWIRVQWRRLFEPGPLELETLGYYILKDHDATFLGRKRLVRRVVMPDQTYKSEPITILVRAARDLNRTQPDIACASIFAYSDADSWKGPSRYQADFCVDGRDWGGKNEQDNYLRISSPDSKRTPMMFV